MKQASAIRRPGTSGLAVLALSGALALSGCALPVSPPSTAVAAPAAGPAAAGSGAAAAGSGAAAAAVAAGAQVRNPASGRLEAVVPDISRSVLLIGDSQSEPADGWPRLGLAAAGYKVYFCGRGGTGFVAANGRTGNYIEALRDGDWLLPSGTPALIVIQGGGNDAATGASDRQIVANAETLIGELQSRYPGTRLAMIGTLARSKNDGGGRRTEVDALLGTVAARHNLPFVSVGDWLTRHGLAKDLADAVHMNAAGRQSLGRLLAQQLRALGLDRTTVPDAPPVLAAGAGTASGD